MGPKLITMLTHHDETVGNAFDVFDQCADLPAECWGFKDVGLPRERMRGLVTRMKQAGKTTFLEVVSLSERECLDGARLAVDCGFDYLMGTVFHDSVLRFMEGQATRFFPFCGRVYGHPSVLGGTVEEIVADARRLQELGVDGLDLLAYRYTGDAEAMSAELLRQLRIPVVMAGSIDGYPRLEAVKRLAPWGFTIGSAFFERKFVPGGSFREQVSAVLGKLPA